MKKSVIFILVCIFTGSLANFSDDITTNQWHQRHWVCDKEKGFCTRKSGPPASVVEQSPRTCRLVCGKYGSLWPRPTILTSLGNQLNTLNPVDINFNLDGVSEDVHNWLIEVNHIFLSNLHKECGGNCSLPGEIKLTVKFTTLSTNKILTWDTDEGYSLDLTTDENHSTAIIESQSLFGLRHGLETLTQFVASYLNEDGHHSGLLILHNAHIKDRPAYPHRGLMLDTSRHYLPISTIYRTMDGMAASKLNVLHWHLTDTQSFPFDSPSVPQLVRFGAYAPDKIYTVDDMKKLFHYANVRGIRILLEIDAPAHAGSGWQWGIAANLGELAVCWRHSPWHERCVQPPCGQLNPANSHLYPLLKALYKDILSFSPKGEIFHMGGDEVFFPCWNATKQITDLMEKRGMGRETADFLKLWAEYQATVLRIFDEIVRENSGNQLDVSSTPIILWSSQLTNPISIESYLPKERYVIQTWVVSEDPLPNQLSELGYKVIMSTKDAWYLDHGFWGKTTYHSWRKAYNNRLPRYKTILGGEACMWSEYVDEHNIDARIWPRASAVAERLWTDPNSDAAYAESRLATHRERLSLRGIKPEAIQPYWCYQNEGQCS